MKKLDRYVGLDIIKVFATIFVLSVHFFGKTHFYSTPLVGINMYFQTFLRMSFLICVPLFMIITGYLQENKLPTKEYFKKIIPIIIIYIIYSMLAIITNKFYLKDNKSILEYIASILNFSADEYSWYVNMYIGLFLLAPFLNVLYQNLEKKQKHILIGILLVLTALPNFLNGKIHGILYFPNFWGKIYPITYYFIGSYIKEYKVKINKFLGLIFILFITLVETGIEVHYAGGGIMKGMVGDYPSLLIVMHATAFFLVFYNIQIHNRLLVKLISIIAILSLDIYLVSYITDQFVYKYFMTNYYHTTQQILYWFFPIVGSTFLLAFVISYIRHKLIKVR